MTGDKQSRVANNRDGRASRKFHEVQKTGHLGSKSRRVNPRKTRNKVVCLRKGKSRGGGGAIGITQKDLPEAAYTR